VILCKLYAFVYGWKRIADLHIKVEPFVARIVRLSLFPHFNPPAGGFLFNLKIKRQAMDV